ncbi:uncharacterized protein LOC134374805 isoform X2 [Cynocephalus volans]|uniref:uncharacterized protein LOC134374805 isoform X2 n=1 Tax=Cynocephalus volans TaxID=110931 RepID=UPI002FCAAE4B
MSGCSGAAGKTTRALTHSTHPGRGLSVLQFLSRAGHATHRTSLGHRPQGRQRPPGSLRRGWRGPRAHPSPAVAPLGGLLPSSSIISRRSGSPIFASSLMTLTPERQRTTDTGNWRLRWSQSTGSTHIQDSWFSEVADSLLPEPSSSSDPHWWATCSLSQLAGSSSIAWPPAHRGATRRQPPPGWGVTFCRTLWNCQLSNNWEE